MSADGVLPDPLASLQLSNSTDSVGAWEPTLAVNRYGTLIVDWMPLNYQNQDNWAQVVDSTDGGQTFSSPRYVSAEYPATWDSDVSTTTTGANGTAFVSYLYRPAGCSVGSLGWEVGLSPLWNNGSMVGSRDTVLSCNSTGGSLDRDWLGSTPNGTIFLLGASDGVQNNGTVGTIWASRSWDGVHFEEPRPIIKAVKWGGKTNTTVLGSVFVYNDTLWGASYVEGQGSDYNCEVIVTQDAGGTWSTTASRPCSGYDPSQGSWLQNRTIELVYEAPDGIDLVQSTDLGRSWSAPDVVSGGTPAGTSFATPTIDTAPATGVVAVTWLDTRSNVTTGEWQVYGRISYDSGVNWGPIWNVSGRPTGLDLWYRPGDFIRSTITPWGTVASVWGDNSSGVMQVRLGELPLVDPTNGNLSVQVVDWTGAPVPSAVVRFSQNVARSDENGTARFYSVRPGNYSVNVTSTVQGVGSGQVAIVTGTTAQVKIQLQPRNLTFGLVASPRIIDLGEAMNISTSISGGFPPYTFVYFGLPKGCRSENRSALTCAPTSPGVFEIEGTATDIRGHVENSSVPITVNPLPWISSVALDPAAIDVGQNFSLRVTGSGGSGPLSYRFDLGSLECAFQNQSTNTCAPRISGNYTIVSTILDSRGFSSSANLTLTVFPKLVMADANVSRSVSEVGVEVNLSMAVHGGTPRHTFSYEGLPLGCDSANLPTISCVPAIPGNYTLNLSVVDAAGESQSALAELSVRPPLTVRPDPPAGVDLQSGAPLSLALEISGGIGPYSVVWSGLPSGCESTNSAHLQCSPVGVGRFLLEYRVMDGVGAQGSGLETVVVQATIALSPTPSGLPLGSTLLLVGGPCALAIGSAFAIISYRRGRPRRVEPPDSGPQPDSIEMAPTELEE